MIIATSTSLASAGPAKLSKTSLLALLAEPIPPPQPVVEGLIYAGALTILSSPPKSGKSFLSLDIAGAVATGRPALGALKVARPGPVLYLALEDGRARIRARALSVLEHDDALAGVQIVDRIKDMLSTPEGLAALETEVREGGYALVIIDTFAAATDESQRRDVFRADYRLISSIRDAVTSHGAACLLVTHDRKAGANDQSDGISSVAGTGGLTAAADAILKLKKANGGKTATLEVISRDFPEVTYQLQRARGRSGWELVGGAPDEPAPSAYERVLAALPADGAPVELKVIIEFFSGTDVERGTVQVWLKRAKDAGLVDRAGWGLWKLKGPTPAATDGADPSISS